MGNGSWRGVAVASLVLAGCATSPQVAAPMLPARAGALDSAAVTPETLVQRQIRTNLEKMIGNNETIDGFFKQVVFLKHGRQQQGKDSWEYAIKMNQGKNDRGVPRALFMSIADKQDLILRVTNLLQGRLQDLDKDGDGALSRPEFETLWNLAKARNEPFDVVIGTSDFPAADKDGNGKLNTLEFFSLYLTALDRNQAFSLYDRQFTAVS